MTIDTKAEVTSLLVGLAPDSEPDQAAATADELMLRVYPELRRLAQSYLLGERGGHTLEPTALVHEAYLRLVDQDQVDWQGKTHFLAFGARIMRQILIDHARGKRRVKRGGGWQRVSFDARTVGASAFDMEQVLALGTALDRLGRLDPRQAKILELRLFGGLAMQDIATLLKVSKRTVEGDWAHARAWLRHALDGG